MNLLKQMDEYICNKIGNEDCWIIWITLGVPDGATEDDYCYIANDNEEWVRICQLFGNLLEEFDKSA